MVWNYEKSCSGSTSFNVPHLTELLPTAMRSLLAKEKTDAADAIKASEPETDAAEPIGGARAIVHKIDVANHNIAELLDQIDPSREIQKLLNEKIPTWGNFTGVNPTDRWNARKKRAREILSLVLQTFHPVVKQAVANVEAVKGGKGGVNIADFIKNQPYGKEMNELSGRDFWRDTTAYTSPTHAGIHKWQLERAEKLLERAIAHYGALGSEGAKS